MTQEDKDALLIGKRLRGMTPEEIHVLCPGLGAARKIREIRRFNGQDALGHPIASHTQDRTTLAEADLDELVERVARRVIELLDERGPGAPLVDAEQLAEILGVSRSTVYGHADSWGALKVGGVLRFDWREVKERLRQVKPKPKAAPAKRGPGRPRKQREGFTASGVPLLPVGPQLKQSQAKGQTGQ